MAYRVPFQWYRGNLLQRTAYNWDVHGLPRCGDYQCRRLLWPWFDIGGNGEEAMCRDCTDGLNRRSRD